MILFFSDVHKCINLCLKFTSHVNEQSSVDVESANNNFAFQEEPYEGSRPEYRVRWNEDADEQMKRVLENSSIDELNDLSTVLEDSDLLAIYSDKMKELYNKCSVLKRVILTNRKLQNLIPTHGLTINVMKSVVNIVELGER